jgi:Rps23 Pro-64 3,4-dihydroxylase Tpa1-like proline 4-hydroxylase
LASARLVRVEILLAGGHRQRLELASDSAVLQALLDAMAARLAPRAGRVLFQIPLDEGRSALTFTSEQLVALTTEPPVLAGVEDAVVTPEQLSLVRARHVRYVDVLGAAEKARLLDGAIARAADLVPSRVAGSVREHRRSRVVERPEQLTAPLVRRVRELVPELCQRLEVPPFPVGQIEAQITVHNDGDYYRVHTDNGTEETRTRVISYVYYFHRQPKRFTGGELALFDTGLDGEGRTVPLGSPVVVEPADDSLVAFPSSCLHEVRPVEMASHALEDSRFTVNGWVRRAG